MKKSQVFLLFAVLSLACFYLWSKVHRLESEHAEYEKNRYFSGSEMSNVAEVSVASREPEFEYRLEVRGDRWYLDRHLADGEKTPGLVYALLDLQRERQMEEDPTPEQLSSFGLVDPSYRISVTPREAQEPTRSVELGNRAPDGNHFYGRLQGDPAVHTVPAYMLSPLEEKPGDLVEKSLFPVEVAAVLELEWQRDGLDPVELTKVENEQRFTAAESPERALDDQLIRQLLYRWKDSTAARFLDADEEVELGPPVLFIRAKETGLTGWVAVELYRPVAVNPSLRYGRRYLLDDSGESELPNTSERFVAELPFELTEFAPELDTFDDLRVYPDPIDEIRTLHLSENRGELQARRQNIQSWSIRSSDGVDPQNDPSGSINELLWWLRDLRRLPEEQNGGAFEPNSILLELELKDDRGRTSHIRFAQEESGNPFVVVDGEPRALAADSLKPLEASLAALFSEGQTPSDNEGP